jgi:hypothetical protein
MDTPNHAERPAKLPYTPPQLTCHGDVEELTQGLRRSPRNSDAPALGGRRLRGGFETGS